MKVIIAGSRYLTDMKLVEDALDKSGFYNITEVVCGMARGIDTLGRTWALEHNIYVKEFPAHWYEHGRAAGPIRNLEMAEYADALIAIPSPDSIGTWDMIDKARANGLEVYVHNNI